MSLINEALKKAQKAPSPAPPPLPATPLKPVLDPPKPWGRQALGLGMPVAFGLIALVGLLLVWQWRQAGARLQPAPVAPPPPPVTVPAPAPAPAAAAPVPTPPEKPPLTSAPAAAPSAPEQPSLSSQTSSISTTSNAPAVPAEAAPVAQPAPLRLQAIFYSPTAPSAIINGQTYSLGDQVGGLCLKSITAGSVTLVGVTQTNVLSLRAQP